MRDLLWTAGFLVGGIAIAVIGVGRLFPHVARRERIWAVLDFLAAATWIAAALRIGGQR